MSQKLCWCLIGLMLVASCASYKPTAVPTVSVGSLDYRFNADGYGVHVDPYIETDRQKKYFNANLKEAGFLPLLVTVKNNGTGSVTVRPADMYIVLPGGDDLAPVTSDVVAQTVEEGGSITGSTLAFGFIGGIAASESKQESKRARVADYASKQLKETVLVPGDSTYGFVFYRLPTGTSGALQFQARLSEVGTNRRSIVEAPLTGY
jgi:hypothetical protein